jgi:phage baseplate assembly protein W
MPKIADYYTEIDKQSELYSDFMMNFDIHPNKRDLIRKTNEESVKRSIRNLILTDKFERLMQPRIGGNIRALLFEPINMMTKVSLQNLIENTIKTYEPRAILPKQDAVIATPSADEQAYYVRITFGIKTSVDPIVVNIQLNRVR